MEEDKPAKEAKKEAEEEDESVDSQQPPPSLLSSAPIRRPYRWLLHSAAASTPSLSLVASALDSISRMRKMCADEANEDIQRAASMTPAGDVKKRRKRALNDAGEKKERPTAKKQRQTKKGKEGKAEGQPAFSQPTAEEVALEAYLEQIDWDDIAHVLGLDAVEK